ncbi:ribose 5-phosphate isomerase B [Kineothrix alysoides]|uniref:Ribose 5-phosphate isomerase B n=1 Tax=Kineothrix alysoides TaxID=1469948 RepID=A0A4R1R0N6_9FIRM|nr:ribose 5-phosphate isomerase B [Kineothrix alysoides]TCL58870.1 ribose 5-phosphate isomerase B [Kineothrix alysoides]
MIILGSDHAGFSLKLVIIDFFERNNIDYMDIGTYEGERGDYPNYAFKVAEMIVRGDAERGILFCGTGIGMAIAANKIRGIRCAVCSEPYSALLSRQHNNSNILSLGARVVGSELAIMIVKIWLEGEYEHGRHQNRLDIVENYKK